MRALLCILCSSLFLSFGSSVEAVVGGSELRSPPQNSLEQFILKNTLRVVYVDENGQREVVCTGIAISTNEILTAGHCLRGYPGDMEMKMSRSFIYAEILAPQEKAGYRRVALEWAAIRYNVYTDLGYARLTADIRTGDPVPLVAENCDEPTKMSLAGFGFDEEGHSPDQVRRLNLAADSPKVLKSLLDQQDESVRQKPDLKAALLQKDGRACFGDSGAPVFCKAKGVWSLAGILSSVEGTKVPDAEDELAVCHAKSHAVVTSFPKSALIVDEMRKSIPAAAPAVVAAQPLEESVTALPLAN